MVKKFEVRKQMGLVQLLFIEINPDCTQYKYTHSDKWYKFHPKWVEHKKYFRSRKFAAVLTSQVHTESKSKSSYDVLGVLAIFESREQLSYVNTQYWNTLQLKTGDINKALATLEFAYWLREEHYQVGLSNNVYAATIAILEAILIQATATKTEVQPSFEI